MKIRWNDASEKALSTMKCHVNVGNSLILLSKILKEILRVRGAFRMSLSFQNVLTSWNTMVPCSWVI